MRRYMAGVVLSLVVLLPKAGTAQQSPQPEVTAAQALWQINGDPILVQGLEYIPTREFRMFDGQVMTQIATHRGVPLYADVTMAPFTVVYVPVGTTNMRAYVRPAEGVNATAESRLPALPSEHADSEGIDERHVGARATVLTALPNEAPPRTTSLPQRTLVESIRRPRGINGVWLEFEGARWYNDGPAVSYSPERFTQIGDCGGFPVYRESNGKNDAIWIPAVKDGPVAPFAKR